MCLITLGGLAMSKYLIGLIPSIFILIIACFAKATPVQQHQVFDTNTQYFKTIEPGKALLNHKK